MPGIEYLFIIGSAGGGTASGVLASMKRIAMNELGLKACIIVTILHISYSPRCEYVYKLLLPCTAFQSRKFHCMTSSINREGTESIT